MKPKFLFKMFFLRQKLKLIMKLFYRYFPNNKMTVISLYSSQEAYSHDWPGAHRDSNS